jgi:type IV pilus assembly protein PilY1
MRSRAAGGRFSSASFGLAVVVSFGYCAEARSASLNLSQMPLFLTEGVAPNIMVTLDNSGSMEYAYTPDGIGGDAGTRRFASAVYNGSYYSPYVTYSAPYSVTYGGGELSVTQLSTSFTAAYLNGFKTSKGTLNLSNAYRVTKNYDPSSTSSTMANNPSADFGGSTTTTTVTRTNRTNTGVPAYYYLYDTSLATCTVASTSSDTCYRLVTVSSTSSPSSGDERQNFANWYSFYRNRALAAQSATNIAMVNLSQNVRLAFQTLANSDGCAINKTGSCNGLDGNGYDTRLRTFSGTQRAQFFKWLGDIQYGGGTPLLTALNRVGAFIATTGVNNPYAYSLGNTTTPEYACRASYSLMVTDGLWNTDLASGNFDGSSGTLPDGTRYAAIAPYKDSYSNTLADLAFKYWKTDARTDIANELPRHTEASGSVTYGGNTLSSYWNPRNDPATWQHLSGFYVGIGLTRSLTSPAWTGDTFSGGYDSIAAGTLAWPEARNNSANNVYDLWHAAIDSRGEFFSADSPDTLLNALQSIVTRINETNSASASQAITSPLASSAYTSSDTYTPSFSSEDWSGELVKAQTTSSTSKKIWSAQKRLDSTYGSGNSAYANRPIYIKGGSSSGGLASFTWANLTTAQKSALNRTLDNATDSNGEARVAWLHGDRSKEGALLRARSHILGDIVNSTPVVVGTPSSPASLMNALENTASYGTFQQKWSARDTRIYVGANDGMLHAFDADGNETFAFIPSAVIGNLYKLSDRDYTSKTHQSFVDGTPTVADVYFDNAWHTVLVGSLRGGGRALFALDITDPDNIKLLWEKSYADTGYGELGYTYAKPVIARLHNGDWAVIAANGYNGASDKAVLYLMDVKNGSLINSFTVSDGSTAANGLSSPFAAAVDGDLIVDYVYAGDLHGNLWRFDLIGSSGSLASTATASNFRTAFNGKPLYTAEAGKASNKVQPITASPYVVRHPSGTGHIVVFGTGKYLEAEDAAADTTKAMSFYGIWDTQTAGQYASRTPSISRSDLQQQTFGSDTSIDYTSTSGDSVATTANTLSSNAIAWYNSAGSIDRYGWYIDLPLTGEMVVNKPSSAGSALLFSSLVPNDDPCESGATTYLTLLDAQTGGVSSDLKLSLGLDTPYSRLQMDALIGGIGVLSFDGGITLIGADAGSVTADEEASETSLEGVDTTGLTNRRQSWREILPVSE